ncbi:MAG: metallophosphoesterase family protein, partial [Mycobacterium leprae]
MDRRRFLQVAGTVLATAAAGCAHISLNPKGKNGSSAALPGGGGAPPTTPEAGQPYRVALLSDVHLQPANSSEAGTINGKLRSAMADLDAVKPDLWLVTGDISDHGQSVELEAFRDIAAKHARPGQLLVTTGNHEFYDMKTTDDISLARFKEAFGLTQPYNSAVFGGIHYVMLADEQWKTAPTNKDWCWITDTQLQWFERVLSENRDKFTVVCSHQPLNETVSGSQGEKAFGGINKAKELYALLEKNPQVKLWFSGHTHRRLEAADQTVKKGQTTFMGL